MSDYRRATPAQIARVIDLAEITGITVDWLDAWYRAGFGRSLFAMDAQTAREIIRYVAHWPIRLQQPLFAPDTALTPSRPA